MGWLAAADTTPQVPWWVAIGGAAATGLVVGLLSFVGNWLQRRHDREMREKDHQRQQQAQDADHRQERELRQDEHQHDLAVSYLEDQQRLRDERLRLLRSGLEEAVDALFELSKLSFLVFETETDEKKAAYDAATAHYERARARLVLDPAGDKVARAVSAVELEIQHYRSKADLQSQRLKAAVPGAERHEEALEQQKGKIDGMIVSAVERAQKIIGEVAQPIAPPPEK